MIDDAVDEDESLHKNEVGMEGDENKTWTRHNFNQFCTNSIKGSHASEELPICRGIK